MKLKVKVSHVDVENNTIFLQFASENSKHRLEDYPEVGFMLVVNSNPLTYVDEFITSRLQEIQNYVALRDALEQELVKVDYESWKGFTNEYNVDLPDPFGETQTIPVVHNPEVEI